MNKSYKPIIFYIHKLRKIGPNNSEIYSNQKVDTTKKRSPWSTEEDKVIGILVSELGCKNWTLLAKKFNDIFYNNRRTGKQCRERWHNHLNPDVKKLNWTSKEEDILFSKHMKYGNKWSEIAKWLPGRTDNNIKNHFYSKLRKFLRKIIKQILKEGVFEENNIDPSIYTADKIYKIMKKNNVPYNKLTKEYIIDLIIKQNICEPKTVKKTNYLNIKTNREKIYDINSDNDEKTKTLNLITSINKLEKLRSSNDTLNNTNKELLKIIKNLKDDTQKNISNEKNIQEMRLFNFLDEKFTTKSFKLKNDFEIISFSNFVDEKELINNNTLNSILNINTSNSYEKYKTINELKNLSYKMNETNNVNKKSESSCFVKKYTI